MLSVGQSLYRLAKVNCIGQGQLRSAKFFGRSEAVAAGRSQFLLAKVISDRPKPVSVSQNKANPGRSRFASVVRRQFRSIKYGCGQPRLVLAEKVFSAGQSQYRSAKTKSVAIGEGSFRALKHNSDQPKSIPASCSRFRFAKFTSGWPKSVPVVRN